MTGDLDPRELRELLGAYALGALDDDERAQVEQFLLDDPEARSELHALQLGAAWLARGEAPPPAHVWSRVAAEVEAELGRERASVPASAVPPSRWRSRARRPKVWLVAAALAAVIATAVVVVASTGDGSSSRQDALAHAIREAERSPGARDVQLTAPQGAAAARVVVLPGGRGFVTSAVLPRLDARRSYQLWALTASGPVSGAVLGRVASPARFRYPRAATAFAITVEHRGGSRAPHGTPVAKGAIPA